MKCELLAPAGDLECLKVAISSGADAVYLGMSDFNARNNLANFSREDLVEGVKIAHMFGVKVYVTLNILIKDEEICQALDFVRFAIGAKVDAFIVQDIGFASLLKQSFKGIELHASTQMGVSTLEGACFLKEQGFSRVVLARETQLQEIKRIKDNLDVELEYFVQGALCVGYSGNCYFSSLEENASGNRGKCKQLCRLPFVMDYLGNKKQGFLLSTKDLCLLPALKDLLDAGVVSLKIEGRARRSAYVAGVVSIYRKALNENCAYDEGMLKNLKQLFNRGNYACGYLKHESMIYPQINSHIGNEIGRVVLFKKGNKFNEVVVESCHEIIRGDVLLFVSDKMQSISVYDVNKTKENHFLITTTNMIDKTAKVNLLVDAKYEKDLIEKDRKIVVDARFEGGINQAPKLTLKYNNLEVTVSGEEVCQEAKSQVLSEDECKTQIAKMGDYFTLGEFEFECEKIFLRKAELNKLRRDAVALLQDKIIYENEKHLLDVAEIKPTLSNSIKNNKKIIKNDKKIVVFDDLNKIKYVEDGNYLVYAPEIYKKDDIIKVCNSTNKTVYLYTPVYAEEKDIAFFKDLLLQVSNLGILANNYYALDLAERDKTIVGSELNVYNTFSVELYKKLGFHNIILSKEAELHIEDKEGLFVSDLKENLIYFKHCPIKEHLGGNCGSCKYKNGITYSLSGRTYLLKRMRVNSCLFYLKSQHKGDKNAEGFGVVEEV